MTSNGEHGTLRPGARVGTYVLAEILGCGASGTVWRAEGPEGPVAVKCLHPELATDAVIVDRFVAEHAMLTAVVHPNLVGIRALVREAGVLALVLDLVEGVTVRERVEAGPMSPAEAASIGAGVCRALAAVHAAGVVHRDVKPENVLLGRDGRPHLADFGVAFATGQRRSTTLGRPVGTVEYVAPELVGGAVPTPASDVYSVGVLMYELLSGQPPFRAVDPLAVLYRHVHTPPPYPMAAPPQLAALVLRCLAKDPVERPDAAEVAALLEGGRAGAPPGTPRAAPVPAAPVPATPAGSARRRRFELAGAIVLVGALAAGVGVAFAGPLPMPGARAGATAEGPPGETYPAPTGWICTPWRPLPGAAGATFRPCVLALDHAIAGKVQLNETTKGAHPAASPTDLELQWRWWTGSVWRRVGAVACPVESAVDGAETCPGHAGEGGPVAFALVATPVDSRGAALRPGVATPTVTAVVGRCAQAGAECPK